MTPMQNLNIVPFVSVDNMMKLVLHLGPERVMTDLATYIEADFRRWESFDKTPRVASHSAVGVIELMPTSDGEMYGFKYVNGHPKNTREGLQTVTAFGLLAEVNTGYPILLTELTILTALRTAAMSALARRFSCSLAPGRYLALVCRALISATVAGSRAHSTAGALRATSEATVVPHEPPPSSPTLSWFIRA